MLKLCRNYGDYGPQVCDSPHSNTPESSDSGTSMNNHLGNATPPESPANADSPGSETAAGVGRLSLESDYQHGQSQDRRGRGLLGAARANNPKRSASSELPRLPGKQSLRARGLGNVQPAGSRSFRNPNSGQRGRPFSSKNNASNGHQHGSMDRDKHPRPYDTAGSIRDKPLSPAPKDSGYVSLPSRQSTIQQTGQMSGIILNTKPPTQALPKIDERSSKRLTEQRKGNALQSISQGRYHPDLILQPDSSPISQDQLAAEVKGIYGGLVMVEAKCINIDAAQAADPTSQLGPEHWQALIALHRTLLYEHHDFLMATQHPSATPALRGLATKYSMPARMWKHGIHAFLEVLRHRRPDSQDYMLAFIYLAYQMIALLFETVPTFIDTWIECLGDLARYRMAIEDEKEPHATWGNVAARWYTMASDRHPNIGRLNHHLGILERPSLRKLFLYAKALTCVIPFPNARDSLNALCGPIIHDERTIQKGNSSAEAAIISFFARIFSGSDSDMLNKTALDALSRLSQQTVATIRDFGVLLVVINIAALLELGVASNLLWQLFGKAISTDIQSSRPSTAAAGYFNTGTEGVNGISLSGTHCISFAYDFCYNSFNTLLRHQKDRQSVRDILPSVHTILVWFQSIHTLPSRVKDDGATYTVGSLMNPERFSWGGLCSLLNMLARQDPISARIVEYARQGTFIVPERGDGVWPLAEDFLIRGLIWTQFYFPSGWFDKQNDEDSRAIETASSQKHRVERVQWLALYLAFRTEYIKFDLHARSFWAPVPGQVDPVQLPKIKDVPQEQIVQAPKSALRSHTTLPAESDTEEGYTMVPAPQPKPTRTWANVASRQNKASQDYGGVKVFDEENVQWGS